MTRDKLFELLHYDPLTGIWTWRKTRSRLALKGSEAGTVSVDGYRIIHIGGKLHRAHRLAWLYMTGEWPPEMVDHKNNVRLDNRWVNLRLATPAQNSASCLKSSSNTSGFKGVYWSKHAGRWRAQISIHNKTVNLGYFDTPETAHAAYMAEAKRAYGEFAKAA